MKTKKIYMEPEMKTVVVSMPTALLAGSGGGLITPTDNNISGQDWEDD